MSRPQGHRVAGRIKSIKYSSDTIGNQSRDLAAYTAVPQPNATPTAAYMEEICQFARSNAQVKKCIFVTLANDKLDAQIFNIYYSPLHVHVSSNILLILRRSNCINTASGIVIHSK